MGVKFTSYDHFICCLVFDNNWKQLRTVTAISCNLFLTLFKKRHLIAELPVISPTSINGSYTEGSSVNISCTATGKPDPEVSWLRNGQIKSSGRKISYLNFDRIKRTDDGLYTCTANNSAGTKTRIESLVVRCESEIFKFLYIKLKFHRKQTKIKFPKLDI